MKICVPVTEDNRVDDHFGHCDYYKVFNISGEGKISNEMTIESPEGCGCKSNIASTLAENGVTVMLAGGIGNGAINVLNNAGIDVVRGCAGDAADVVMKFIQGSLVDSGESCTTHNCHNRNTE